MKTRRILATKFAAALAAVAFVALAFSACPDGSNGGDPPLVIEMVQISAGDFTMGSPTGEPDRVINETQHTVTLSGFWMGKYEVTQAQYQTVMGTNPSSFKTATNGENPAKRPVETVSWFNAIVFCNKLSMLKPPAKTPEKTREISI